MSERPEPTLRVHNVSKSFGANFSLQDVTFDVYPGEMVGLIGPNGAGKTTLLECVAGVLPRDSGTIEGKLFYMPDAIAPWPEQPVAWVMRYFVNFFAGHREMFDALTRDLRLEMLLPLRIRALSKGQRKRFLLALALLAPHTVVLIDEPFDGLDLRQARETEAVLRKYLTPDRALLLSIHQISDAARICDRFLLLSAGKLVASGTLAELNAQAHMQSTLEDAFLALA